MVKVNNLKNDISPYVLTKHNLLLNVGQESPRATELLAEYGFHCLSCFFSEYDTLEAGASMHGMSDNELDDMINEINTQLEKEWRESKVKGQSSRRTPLDKSKAGRIKRSKTKAKIKNKLK